MVILQQDRTPGTSCACQYGAPIPSPVILCFPHRYPTVFRLASDEPMLVLVFLEQLLASKPSRCEDNGKGHLISTSLVQDISKE